VSPPTFAQFSLTLRVRIDHRPGMLGPRPSAFNRAVAPAVADAVPREARRSGRAEAGAADFGYTAGDTSEFRAVTNLNT
jgi:hypothetical protein